MGFRGLVFATAIVVSVSMCNAYTIATSERLEVAAEELNGEILIELGNRTNTTLLQMVGFALMNLDVSVSRMLCESIPCSPWSEWSKCSASTLDTFGSQVRTRDCTYGTAESCADPNTNTTDSTQRKAEHASQFCQGSVVSCPEGYTSTENGFCLQFVRKELTQATAEENCQQHGGHLINIDTEERWEDFLVLLRKQNTNAGTYWVWIDGTRTVADGSWTYVSGTDPASNGLVNHWRSGEPEAKDKCVAVYTIKEMFGVRCENKSASVCEVRTG